MQFSLFARSALAAAALSTLAGSALAQSSASQTTTGTSTIIQPITLTAGTGLAFGTLVRPSTGSGIVTIDQTSGARTVTGGVVALASTTSRATYTVGGEGGQTFSIAVPATFSLTGPSTIAVTLTPTAATGVYSGSYNVTVAYN